MGNLFTSIISSAGALRAFSGGLSTVQNNIANLSTPGYAKQIQGYEALPFDLRNGLPGGVQLGDLVSSRAEFAERAVRRHETALGYSGQRAAHLALLEPIFSIDPDSGLQAALNGFFRSFSSLSVSPNSGQARQNVLDRAAGIATQFRQAARLLSDASTGIDRQLGSQVNRINNILERIQVYNLEFRSNIESHSDPGVDAFLHAALEELSEYVSFDVIRHENGSLDLLLGGQVPVLIGGNLYPLSVDLSSGSARILDAQALDVTAKLSSGQLGGALNIRNEAIPRYLAGLDTLAAAFADRVNETLNLGLDQNGNPPSLPLFQYDASAGAASTLEVNPLTSDGLAAASSLAPGGNGNALELAKLADSRQVEGATFFEYLGGLSGRLGQDLSSAREESSSRAALLSQARDFRSQASSVSLDEEASRLIQFQRSYEAAARVIRTLDEMTQTLVNILP